MTRGRALLVAITLLATTVLATAAATAAATSAARSSSAVDSPARAEAIATRGAREPTRPIPPPPGPEPCERVVVIGDSLMDNARWWLDNGLRDAGFVRLVDAHHTRRIPASVSAPFSGVKAALAVRATWGEADCWVIALGSNDLAHGANTPPAVNALIAEMLGVLTPGARVWWVNVDYHRDPRTLFDFPGATRVFNAELDARAAADDRFEVIDWYSYAEANPHWFFDPVHVDRAGSIARAQQVVDALPR